MAWANLQPFLLSFTLLIAEIEGHGRLLVPPGRPTACREGFGTPIDYNDNGKNCGGMSFQWNEQGGKCGICGDPYNLPQPRPLENGGTFGKGVIVREWVQAQVIDVQVELTAPHLGWFEFRLCKLEDTSKPATLACLDRNLLASTAGQTRISALPNEAMVHEIALRLPRDLTCDHCVFQWKYHGGNSWGTDENGSGIGYGYQEEFFSCADVKVRPWRDVGGALPPTPPEVPTTSRPATTTTLSGPVDGPTPAPTTTVVAEVTPDPDAIFKCHFQYATGKDDVDSKLDDLCSCACNRNKGICDSTLCFCY